LFECFCFFFLAGLSTISIILESTWATEAIPTFSLDLFFFSFLDILLGSVSSTARETELLSLVSTILSNSFIFF